MTEKNRTVYTATELLVLSEIAESPGHWGAHFYPREELESGIKQQSIRNLAGEELLNIVEDSPKGFIKCSLTNKGSTLYESLLNSFLNLRA